MESAGAGPGRNAKIMLRAVGCALCFVDALTRLHGISAARLQSEGVGALAPVASNASEEGKARNRRVERVQE